MANLSSSSSDGTIDPTKAKTQALTRGFIIFSVIGSVVLSILSAILLTFSLFSSKMRHRWKWWAAMLGVGLIGSYGTVFVIFGKIQFLGKTYEKT
ncbi:hypothetical protein [Runella zeae]|uniref:hypothetical protein n=1 Tax=Runella zeae TaxID=94255 RepID=UPI0004103E4B|nr:hypothetical protein [Runella zeae]